MSLDYLFCICVNSTVIRDGIKYVYKKPLENISIVILRLLVQSSEPAL